MAGRWFRAPELGSHQVMNALYRHLTAHIAQEALAPNLGTKPGHVNTHILPISLQKNR